MTALLRSSRDFVRLRKLHRAMAMGDGDSVSLHEQGVRMLTAFRRPKTKRFCPTTSSDVVIND